MGELRIDLDRLRTSAAAVLTAADQIAEIDWPQLDPSALSDSAMSRSTASMAIVARTTDLVAGMRTWARGAQSSATTLAQVEAFNTDRLDR